VQEELKWVWHLCSSYVCELTIASTYHMVVLMTSGLIVGRSFIYASLVKLRHKLDMTLEWYLALLLKE
jgi:hypothetical protein